MIKKVKEEYSLDKVKEARKIIDVEIPAIADELTEHLDWLDIELADYSDGVLDDSYSDYIGKVVGIVRSIRTTLKDLNKSTKYRINNELPDV